MQRISLLIIALFAAVAAIAQTADPKLTGKVIGTAMKTYIKNRLPWIDRKLGIDASPDNPQRRRRAAVEETAARLYSWIK